MQRARSIARVTTRTVLGIHGLDDLTATAVQVVSELAACACRFTPTAEMYVSLRIRDGFLRVSVFDGQPLGQSSTSRHRVRHPPPRDTASAGLCGTCIRR
jgi:hypothetical protein